VVSKDDDVQWPNIYETAVGGGLKDNEGIYDAVIEDATPARMAITQRLSDFRSRRMKWLWEGIVPIGAAVIFAGMGGVSKSTFSIALAGRVTRGSLAGVLFGKPADVLYVSHEDGIEDVVLPRAQVNDVDTERFHIFGVATKVVNGVSMPKFPEDLNLLEEKIAELGARLVIIDPVLSAMPSGRDPNSNVDVRELIDPLNQLAQRLQITIICIAHINKTVTNARTAVTGSAAWSDATRGTLLFAMEDPDPTLDYVDVVFGSTKGNYSRGGVNYTYRLRSHDHTHDSGEVGSIPKVEFLGVSTRTVGDVLAGAGEDRREGSLRGELKAYFDSLPGAVYVTTVYQEFADEKQANIKMTLSRMVRARQVDSPKHGYYQSMKYRPSDRK
jgi:hypothetical protein